MGFRVVAAGVCCACLVLAAGASGAAAPPSDTSVWVRSITVSRPVPPGFLGLSLEYGHVFEYTGMATRPDQIDPVFVRLLDALAPAGQLQLRIGGDSTDWTWWPVGGVSRPAGVSYSLTNQWVDVVRALAQATHAHLVLGINLEANSTRIAGVEARELVSGLGRARIAALELGNEPDHYSAMWYRTADHVAVPGRSPGYGFTRWLADVVRFRGALPALSLAGPALDRLDWLGQLPRLFAAIPSLREVTVHRYPLNRCVTATASPQFPSVGHLLAPVSSTGLAAPLAAGAGEAHRYGRTFRVNEMNSVTCQGEAGVSNTFASALWMLDTLFAMARAGVDGVNIHTWAGAPANQPFTFAVSAQGWSGSVRPEYYGMLLFLRAAPAGARLLRTSIAGPREVRAWAIRAPDGSTRIVLINDSATRRHVALVRLPSLAGTGMLERLRASSLAATTDVTLAGQTFGARTRSGVLAGRLQSTPLAAAGSYRVILPAGSAALLSLGPRH